MASFPVQHYLSFVFMVLGFLALPGPGTFTILLAAKWAGVQGGYSALLGIMVGDLVLMVIAVLGLSALLMSQPKMLLALQTLGIIYLLWIGLSLLLKALKAHQPLSPFKIIHKPVYYLKQGIFITLLNPKAIFFYVAFFPLFIQPQAQHNPLAWAILVAHISLLTFLYGSILVFGGRLMARYLDQHARLAKALMGLMALGFIGCGLKLAFELIFI